MPLHKAFGVDLGSSSMKIYAQEQDTIITEKNMIAIRDQDQVLAVGNKAYEIFEKNPSNVSVISPVLCGKIADINCTEMVLKALLENINAGTLLGHILYLTIPSDLSEIDRSAYYTIENSNRKNKVYMVDKTIADAVGLGIPILHTKGTMIVDIGAQSTEISVIELGKVVVSKLLEIGGNQLDDGIVSTVRKQYNLHIGTRTACRLKLSLAYLKDGNLEARKVVGVDSLSGLPREEIIPSDVVHETITGPIRTICEEILFFLERIPPQIRKSVEDQGIFVTGGTSRIPGMEWFLKQETGQKIRMSDLYELCTICGLKEVMKDRSLKKWVR